MKHTNLVYIFKLNLGTLKDESAFAASWNQRIAPRNVKIIHEKNLKQLCVHGITHTRLRLKSGGM